MNGSGDLSYTEFSYSLDRFVPDWQSQVRLSSKRELFRLLDADGSGGLSLDELLGIAEA